MCRRRGRVLAALDPLTPLLEQPADIRVTGEQALPAGDRHSIKQTDWTYALMMYISDALGVNCTYCHNSHSFADWESSPPTRVRRGTASTWCGT